MNTFKTEQWNTIQGYENYYISSYGRVYSKYHNKLLKPYKCGRQNNQYYTVKLKKGSTFKNERVNVLVAKAFIPNPENKQIVHHKNRDKLNNNADNLQWVTFKEHIQIHMQEEKAEKEKTQ